MPTLVDESLHVSNLARDAPKMRSTSPRTRICGTSLGRRVRCVSELTVVRAGPTLAQFQTFHSNVSPHMVLDWTTPNEYLAYQAGVSTQSHMS